MFQHNLFPLALIIFSGTTVGANDCKINPDNSHQWPEFPPILTDLAGDLLLPVGDGEHREIDIVNGEVVLLSCPGNEFDHETSWEQGAIYATCKGGDNFEVWVEGSEEETDTLGFRDFGCRGQPTDTTEIVGTCGPNNSASEIVIGFDSKPTEQGMETVTITVCHDLEASRTLWSRHTLWDENRNRDHGNDSPPFNPDTYFDYDVNHFYSMKTQKETIAILVQSQDLADEYVQDFHSGLFLARGHLAPNADFVFFTWMDASYHFINVAPQWNIFNSGNWMYFENGCRDFVEDRMIDLVVYTGTHGVCQLEDVNGNMVDILLYGDQLPVPRFYWKVLVDPVANAGVAVVGVNNPHLKSLPADYEICPPIPNHPVLDNVYHPDDLAKGVIWACRVEDLAAVVEEVPELPPMDLLM